MIMGSAGPVKAALTRRSRSWGYRREGGPGAAPSREPERSEGGQVRSAGGWRSAGRRARCRVGSRAARCCSIQAIQPRRSASSRPACGQGAEDGEGAVEEAPWPRRLARGRRDRGGARCRRGGHLGGLHVDTVRESRAASRSLIAQRLAPGGLRRAGRSSWASRTQASSLPADGEVALPLGVAWVGGGEAGRRCSCLR